MTMPLLEYKPLQNVTPKHISRRQKQDMLIQLIFDGNTNITEIAKQLNITRMTAYRWFQKWKQTEEAQQIDMEWWALAKQLQNKTEGNPLKVFEGLTRLKYRMIPASINMDTKETYTERRIIIQMWKPNEPTITDSQT